MSEYDSLDALLKPTKKNRKLLVPLFICILGLDLFFGWILGLNARYVEETNDILLTEPSKWNRTVMILRLLMVISGCLGLTSKTPLPLSVCCSCAFGSFILFIIINFFIMFMSPDKQCTLIAILLFALEMLSMTFIVGLSIILIYQQYVKEDDSRISLDMKDPELIMNRNLMRSILHIIPGIGLFSRKIVEWTKEE